MKKAKQLQDSSVYKDNDPTNVTIESQCVKPYAPDQSN